MTEVPRNLRMVLITPQLVVEFLRPPPATRSGTLHGHAYTFPVPPFEAVRCVEGLPEGARLVAAEMDWFRDELRLLFEHESFDPVQPGTIPPLAHPRFERGDPRSCCFGHPCPECRKEA